MERDCGDTLDDLNIKQYTGLDDCFDNEIWEGDTLFSYNHGILGKVILDKGISYFEAPGIMVRLNEINRNTVLDSGGCV